MMTPVLVMIAAALLLRILFRHVRMQRMLAPAKRARLLAPGRFPSVTIIRPIKGLDVGCRENTEALLAQDYPGAVETLFVLDSPSDPAYPVVAEVLERTRKNARILFAGPRPARRTGKLNAMIEAFAQARGELVAFCDSDSRPSAHLLRDLVEQLRARPDAGSAFAPAVTAGRPDSFAQVVYGLMINSWYGAAAAEMAGAERELPFIMGQIMVFRREALEAIGGLEAAEGQLVDDMFLGAELTKAGYKNVMVRSPLHLVTGPLGLGELSTLLTKWMAFSRSGLPSEFVRRNWWRGLEIGLALALTVAAVVMQEPLLALFAASSTAVWVYSQAALHQSLTGHEVPLRFAIWVPLVVPFLAAALLAKSHLTRKVEWRGQAYQLNAAARLDASARSSAVPTGGLLGVSQLQLPRQRESLV